jgi:hypothetical protein
MRLLGQDSPAALSLNPERSWRVAPDQLGIEPKLRSRADTPSYLSRLSETRKSIIGTGPLAKALSFPQALSQIPQLLGLLAQGPLHNYTNVNQEACHKTLSFLRSERRRLSGSPGRRARLLAHR